VDVDVAPLAITIAARSGLSGLTGLRLPVDALVASWRAERPDLDFSPVEVVSRLGRVRSHVDVALAELFSAYGLGAATFGVLVTLARVGGDRGVSQRRLMDELGLTSGTISGGWTASWRRAWSTGAPTPNPGAPR
jgi:hypothetical protein